MADVKINVTVDTKTGSIRLASEEFKKLGDSTDQAAKRADSAKDKFNALDDVFGKWGKTLADLEAKTGVAVESIQKLTYAGSLVGVSQDAIATATSKMQKEIVAGNEAFAALGLSVDRLRELAPDQAFAAIAASIAEIENPTEQAAAAIAVFGKSGAEMLPLLKSDLRAAADEAERLGIVMSSTTVAGADALGDQIDKLGQTWGAFGRELVASVVESPEVLGFFKDLTEFAGDLVQEVKANKAQILDFVNTVGAAARTMLDLGTRAFDAIGGLRGVYNILAAISKLVFPGVDSLMLLLAGAGKGGGSGAAAGAGVGSLPTSTLTGLMGLSIPPVGGGGRGGRRFGGKGGAASSPDSWLASVIPYGSFSAFTPRGAWDYGLGGIAPAAGGFGAPRARDPWALGSGIFGERPIDDLGRGTRMFGADSMLAGGLPKVDQVLSGVTAKSVDWAKALQVVANNLAVIGRASGTLGKVAGTLAGAAGGIAGIMAGVGQIKGAGGGLTGLLGKAGGFLGIAGAGLGLLGGLFGGLFGGKKKEPPPPPKTVEELFADALAAAEKRGAIGDASVRGMIAGNRGNADVRSYVSEQLSTATSGLGAAVKGIQVLTPEDAQAQASIAALTFWEVFKREGLVAAADAFAPIAETLRESLAKIGGDAAAEELLGPIFSTVDLAANEAFRGAADGAKGLADVLKGLANADVPITTSQFAAFGQQATAAFEQAKAAGAGNAEALMAIAPLLQNIVAVAGSYGLEIDEGTQALLNMAQESGVAFKSDPMERLVEAIERLNETLGGTVSRFDAIGNSIGRIPRRVDVDVVTNQSGGGDGGDGLPGYAEGGIVTRTGPAMLHGSPGNPELAAPVRAFSRQLAADLAAIVGGMSGGVSRIELDGRVLGEALYRRSQLGDLRIAASAVVGGK